MRDTTGFRATISSGMVFPAESATKVHVVMNISYNAIVAATIDSTQFKVPSLNDSHTIIFQKKKIRLESNGAFGRVDNQKFNVYRVPPNEFSVAIDKIRVLDENGKELEKLSGMVSPNGVLAENVIAMGFKLTSLYPQRGLFDYQVQILLCTNDLKPLFQTYLNGSSLKSEDGTQLQLNDGGEENIDSHHPVQASLLRSCLFKPIEKGDFSRDCDYHNA